MDGPGHVLIVPPDGLLEVVHTDHGINEEGTLRQRSEGNLVHLCFSGADVYWLHQNAGQVNPRAQIVLADLSGAHVIFTGTVIFEGIGEQALGEIVGRLSVNDGGYAGWGYL